MLDPSGRHIWWHYTKRIAGIWSHVFPYVRRHHPVVRIDMLMAKSRHKLRSYQENQNDNELMTLTLRCGKMCLSRTLSSHQT